MDMTLDNHRGFTLMEVIMSIVVIAIIGVIAGISLSKIASGYVLSRKNAVIAQQGQIAIIKLKKEFNAIQSISTGTALTITFKSTRPPSQDISICWSGVENDPILMKMNAVSCTGGDKLVDNVKLFALNYCDTYNSTCLSGYSPGTTSIIDITLKLIGYDNTSITIADPDRVVLSLESGG